MAALGSGSGTVGGKTKGTVLSKPKGGTAVTTPPKPAGFDNSSTKGANHTYVAPPRPAPVTTHWAANPNSWTGPVTSTSDPGRSSVIDSGPSSSDFAALAAAQAPQVNPETDYLQEAGYIAQIGALEEAMKKFNSQDTAERGRYDLDYDKGLNSLGYKDNTPGVTTDNLEESEMGNRNWDWNDVLTASGRGYQQNVNDFASRGMIQSQGYFDALDQLTRSLDEQRGSMGTGRKNWRAEKDTAQANYGVQDTAARNTAKIDAISRLSAQLGLL